MNIIKCDSCGNRYTMCFHCIHNKYYRKTEWSHDEYIRQSAIKEFASWCYVNGVDFSYMRKGTDTEPFATTVIKRFNEYIREKVQE